MKYKKGDWVVFPDYNKYPVQLDQDGKYGFVNYGIHQNMFFECTPAESRSVEKPYNYYVRDPRQAIAYSEGWLLPECVRLAQKKDFNPLLKVEKARIQNSEEVLRMYKRVIKSL